MHVSALEVLHQLDGEDDENPEVWYLSGWAWWLLGESRGDKAAVAEDEESQAECWSEAKLCLQNYLTVRPLTSSPSSSSFRRRYSISQLTFLLPLQLEERDPSGTDADQMAHVKELLSKLDAAGVVASAGAAEGDAEWEDASEDEAMQE